MAHINVSEADFIVVAGAAQDAKRRGDMRDAEALDKIARKINAALTHNNPTLGIMRKASGMQGSAVSWRDMPSTIGDQP